MLARSQKGGDLLVGGLDTTEEMPFPFYFVSCLVQLYAFQCTSFIMEPPFQELPSFLLFPATKVTNSILDIEIQAKI